MKSYHPPLLDPTRDQQLLSLGGSTDASGCLLDIHESLYLSKVAGFYLHRQIRQIRKGRTWETAELGEADEYIDSKNIRFLKVLRPMTRAQVIRYVVDAYMPREGSLHLSTQLALDSAGIPE